MRQIENGRRLVIFGSTEMAVRAHFYFDRFSPYACAGFTVHEKYIAADSMLGLPVRPFETAVDDWGPDDHDVFVAVGYNDNNRAREAITTDLESRGYRMASFIAPSAVVHTDAIGGGTIIFDNAVVGPFASVGRGVVIGTNTNVSHHSGIGDFAYLSSLVDVLGGARVGPRCFIGAGAIIGERKSVAADTQVGMGTLVTRSIERAGVYFGSPARFQRDV